MPQSTPGDCLFYPTNAYFHRNDQTPNVISTAGSAFLTFDMMNCHHPNPALHAGEIS